MAIRKIAETVADRTRFALLSLAELFKQPRYLITAIVVFLVFLYILTFFRDGGSNWQLICSGLPFGDKLGVLGRVWRDVLTNFGSLYGVSIIFMALLQGVIIMQLVFTWKNRERDMAIDGASTGTIAAILGFITLGCPSCGVGLLSAILTAIAGTGAAVLAEQIGFILVILAFILMLYTIIRLGYIDYVVISSKKAKESHAKSN